MRPAISAKSWRMPMTEKTRRSAQASDAAPVTATAAWREALRRVPAVLARERMRSSVLVMCVPRERFDRRSRICSGQKTSDRAVQRHPDRALAGRKAPGDIADGCAFDRDRADDLALADGQHGKMPIDLPHGAIGLVGRALNNFEPILKSQIDTPPRVTSAVAHEVDELVSSDRVQPWQ